MRLDGYKIGITGGRGYIGSHTAKSLLAAGAEVYVIDNRYVSQNKVEGTTYLSGDYGDWRLLDKLKRIGIDGFVHCAGTSLVGPSIADPGTYYDNNVAKTIAMLNQLRRWDNKPFIVFSSSAAVYGQPAVVPITEDTLKAPINPYGRTKSMIEDILKDYSAYGLRHYSLRYFNAAGADVWDNELGPEPGDTHIIPRMFEAKLENEPFKLFGTDYNTPDGTCVRDYIHVCDLALSHLAACVKLANGGESKVYNLGTNSGYSNKEVIDAFTRIVGDLEVTTEPRRIGDPDELVADGDAFREATGLTFAYSNIDKIMESFKDFYVLKYGLGYFS